MAAREEKESATPKALKRGKGRTDWVEMRVRMSRQLRDAIQREAASEHMTGAAFMRACAVRILRARSH